MIPILRFIVVPVCCLILPSCVSAWMTGFTGIKIQTGMDRAEVHRRLGPPLGSGDVKEFERSYQTQGDRPQFVDVHFYQGKVNAVDEGSGQAIANALTLGAAEAIMIPMTAVDIAARSLEKHRIDVAYDARSHVINYQIKKPRSSFPEGKVMPNKR